MTTYAVTSEIFTAALVVQVVVERADLGDPVVEPGTGLLRREGVVAVRLADVLKGRLAESVGDLVEVPVVVRRADGLRMRDTYGLWSLLPLDPGTRLVAFCDGRTRSLAAALTDEHCDRLTLSGPVLGDLRLALDLQRRHLPADRLLREAERHRGTGGALFARYVWVAAREALRASPERFDRLMTLAEHPGTRVEAQEAYLLSAYEDLTFTGEFPAAHRARLVRAMLRTALDPRVGELRGLLLQTYVPNLVTAPLPEPLSPGAVFDATAPDPDATNPDATTLRDRVQAELADPRDPVTTSPRLTAWLAAAAPTAPPASPGGA
jgi:hypothetical protein